MHPSSWRGSEDRDRAKQKDLEINNDVVQRSKLNEGGGQLSGSARKVW